MHNSYLPDLYPAKFKLSWLDQVSTTEDGSAPNSKVGLAQRTYLTASLQCMILSSGTHLFHCPVQQSHNLPPAGTWLVYLPFTSLPIFHWIKFYTNKLHSSDTIDSIHAHLLIYNHAGVIMRPAHFDTALVNVWNVASQLRYPHGAFSHDCDLVVTQTNQKII